MQRIVIDRKYRRIKIWHCGNAANVLLVESELDREQYALKICNDRPNSREAIEMEIEILKKVQSDYVISLVDCGYCPQHGVYYVTPIVGGAIQILPEKTVADRLDFFLEICAGIEAVHSAGYIHGDIHTKNVLFGEHATVFDFDHAKQIGTSSRSYQEFGSHGFRAPETLSTHVFDIRSDIFSLGVCLYAILTGYCPEEDKNYHDSTSDFQKIDDIELKKIILKAVTPAKNDRQESVSDLKDDICQLLDNNRSHYEKIIRVEVSSDLKIALDSLEDFS